MRTGVSLACAVLLAMFLPGAVQADEGELAAVADQLPPPAEREVDFVRDIQPILARHCYDCHGAENQESGLRLSNRENAMAGGDGGQVIAPGNSAASAIVQRVAGIDPDMIMPPEGEGEPLSAEQVGLLRAWIDQGAAWPDEAAGMAPERTHWAYQKPVRPELPAVQNTSWCRNPIDYFVLARLEAEGLAPAPEADRATLLRRVSLDLTGLPPTLAEVDAFVADRSPDAYEKVVDRLLASPRYGERWARPWLDLARYADTHGYEKDPRRSIWPWRDWLIRALNDDLPFDRFTIEQLAGDLLPEATLDQIVATGFHRNTMINTEGGTDDEEFRIAAVMDRVNTTATVWLGTTLACAQCHSHKYDPLKHAEYYQFLAFFNSTADPGREDGPTVEIATPEQLAAKRKLEAQLAKLENSLAEKKQALRESQAQWELEQAEAISAGEELPAEIGDLLKVPAGERTEDQQAKLATHRAQQDPQIKELVDRIAALRKEIPQYPTTLVMRELDEPRPSHVFTRGSFLTPAERVSPGVPEALHPFPTDAPRNRLGLAEWLVDEDNPLTARVTVNRFWQLYFGRGIVGTPEDFGTRSEPPSHPELLDWLATEFMSRGWSMKAMHRLIVTSATYRQSSRHRPELAERDPRNVLLARGPRLRLEAEMIRDQALALSGLLSPKIGGPSVMPPQPEGIWYRPYSGDKWETSTGEDKYRRGIYTFMRRTAPYPAYLTFDAPSREFCVVERPRTNTPLQALVTLNDPVYVEAAGALALRMAYEAGDEPSQRAAYGLRLCVARMPTLAEVERLVRLYEAEVARFKEQPAAASDLLQAAQVTTDATDEPELAAWIVVANVLLNLDEVLNKN